MLFLLNTEDFDDGFTEIVKKSEKEFFRSGKTSGCNKPSLYGRVLLSYILNKYHHIKSFSYCYGENGKPYLETGDVFFSISHSGNYVLCCVSDNEIGCDIEKIKAYNPKVGKRFFTAKEAGLLEEAENKDILFYKLWTLKESILKKEGTGINGGLDTYCFADYIGKEYFKAYGYSFYTLLFGEYMISVCSECADYQKEIVSREKITEFIRSLN